MATHATPLDGTAYGRPTPTYDKRLAEVAPGTPCGEFMRRYWQPLLPSDKVTSRPQEIRILGEDLIVFRDRNGRPGLLYPRCMHRGTSLFYGRVEDRGIRCCYHGWLFDVEGQCLEQPCEPNGGTESGRESARQPWYPLRERYGLIWTYMGPPDKMPVLPRYDIMEQGEGETYLARDFALHGDPRLDQVSPYSWLHNTDNIMDPFHVQQLHSTISNVQFVDEFAVMPQVKFREIDNGVIYDAYRALPDGRKVNRISTWMLPHVGAVPDVALKEGPGTMLMFNVPVDDTHSRNLMTFKVKGDAPFMSRGVGMAKMKPWGDRTVEERQNEPGDYEAQIGQGPITLHSEEHLATSDQGIGLLRRMLEKQIKAVEDGGDPIGVAFDENEALIHVPSGNFFS